MQENTFGGVFGVFPYLPMRIVSALQRLPPKRLFEITELRLRAECPLMFITAHESVFLTENGKETMLCRCGLLTVSQTEIEEIVAKACGYSVHSHQEDFKNGYLSLTGGHRIGLCGTAVSEDGVLRGIRAVTSLNIRIAKRVPNAADEVYSLCFARGLQNILLVGPPKSGKSTVLRALVERLSSGNSGRLYTCAVVDERMELFPNNSCEQTPCIADILSGYQKPDGISIAVRVLSPDIIFCDEIGSAADVRAIADGIRCGVHFVATAHAESIEQLKCRAELRPLFLSGAMDTAILLGTGKRLGKVQSIYRVGEHNAESNGNFADCSRLPFDGAVSVRTSA